MMNFLITFADRKATYSVSLRDSTLLIVMCPQQEKLTDNSDMQDPRNPTGIATHIFLSFIFSTMCKYNKLPTEPDKAL